MQTTNKLLDDLARVASGALGVAAGMREEIETAMRQRFSRVLGDFELVTRDEFEAVKAMASKARADSDSLRERVAQLEAVVARLSVGSAPDGTTPEERIPPSP